MKRFPFWSTILCFLISAAAATADPRADFFKLIDHPRVPLAATIEELPSTNGQALFHFSFASDAQQRVPGLLLKAHDTNDRRPVVIALHGTGGTKQDMLSLSSKLVDRGFIAVAID